MGNPKVMAVVSGLVALWLLATIVTAQEAPSTALAVVQYLFLILAIIACVGSIRKIVSGPPADKN